MFKQKNSAHPQDSQKVALLEPLISSASSNFSSYTWPMEISAVCSDSLDSYLGNYYFFETADRARKPNVQNKAQNLALSNHNEASSQMICKACSLSCPLGISNLGLITSPQIKLHSSA